MKHYHKYAYLEAQIQNAQFKEDWNRLETKEQIRRLLKFIRYKNDLTQKELSELSGVSQVIICNLENGKASPNLSTLEKLAHAADMKLSIEFAIDNKKQSSAVLN